jgi:hypothetical protein
MPKKFNSNKISKNVKILKKKLKQLKSQKSVDHLSAEDKNYLSNNYDHQELVVDYNEPVWDGKEYLPTGSIEDYDDSGEKESEASNGDNMDDNDLSNENNEPALPLEESEGIPRRYQIRKRQLEDDEQAVAKFITSSNSKRIKVKKVKDN